MGYKMYIIHILDRWVEELSVKEANDNDSKFAKNTLIQGRAKFGFNDDIPFC